jgi:hypothetical protein
VSLPPALTRFHLPTPPTGEELRAAVRASLRLRELGPALLLAPLLGAVYRAALGEADFAVLLVGPTGRGKSELAALAQQHFGPELDRAHLQGNWSSTANSLGALAFAAKDALCVIDDFKPGGSKASIDQAHALAERVIRAQGNQAGRGRCQADGSLRPTRAPRGLICATGEDAPRGESLRARLLSLPVEADALGDLGRLTPFQRDAAAGLYAQALAGFLRWLAPRFAAIRARLKREHAELRDRARANGQHARTPGIVAELALGWRYFLAFAADSGAVTSAEREERFGRAWEALGEAAEEQAAGIRAQDPARRFLELVAAAVASGRAYLASRDGVGEPANPGAWGWRGQEAMTGPDEVVVHWRPLGDPIGWILGADVYLDPEASYAIVQRLADDQGERLPVSRDQLQRRLKEQGRLASADPERTTVRHILQG